MKNKDTNDKMDESSIEEIDSEILKEAAELGEHLKVQEDAKDEEIKQLKDQVLRVAAEAENSKRRLQKEIEDAKNYSISSFAKDLMSVMDNLYRSLESIGHDTDDSPRIKAIIEGIEAVKKELENAFTRYNIIRIEPKKNDSFDHNFHQAISQVSTNEVEKGKIFSVLQAGYLIKERLLRPALVSLAES